MLALIQDVSLHTYYSKLAELSAAPAHVKSFDCLAFLKGYSLASVSYLFFVGPMVLKQ